jgi:hypothetical protein
VLPYAVKGKTPLQKALQNTIESSYTLFKKDVPFMDSRSLLQVDIE